MQLISPPSARQFSFCPFLFFLHFSFLFETFISFSFLPRSTNPNPRNSISDQLIESIFSRNRSKNAEPEIEAAATSGFDAASSPSTTVALSPWALSCSTGSILYFIYVSFSFWLVERDHL